MYLSSLFSLFFVFNDTATTEIYTLSLHDALPILNTALDVLSNHPNVGPYITKQLIQHLVTSNPSPAYVQRVASVFNSDCNGLDRKSTRLNSSHDQISYAVFCLKKKKKDKKQYSTG